MSYIRDNVDYYVNCGMSPSDAKRQVLKDKLMGDTDYGFCNPMKAKDYSDKEDEVDKFLKRMEESCHN